MIWKFGMNVSSTTNGNFILMENLIFNFLKDMPRSSGGYFAGQRCRLAESVGGRLIYVRNQQSTPLAVSSEQLMPPPMNLLCTYITLARASSKPKNLCHASYLIREAKSSALKPCLWLTSINQSSHFHLTES